MKFSEKIVADEKKFRAEQDTAREMGADRASLSDAKKKYYSENKQRWIADLQKINDEGIARLERIIKSKGGDATPTPAPTDPNQPSGAGPATTAPTAEPTAPRDTPPAKKPTKAQERAAREADEINKLLADVKQLDLMEQAERATQVNSVWSIAESYWNRGGNYSRATMQDKFALLNVLRKPEYGGISDLMGLYDPRLDSETVARILDTRKAIKDAEAATATPPSIREIKKRKSKDSANVNILDAIRSYGGLNIAKISDYAKDKKVGSMFGVFQKQAYSKGWDISDMAMRLAGDNYPINLNDSNDPGGAIQTQALLDRALAGEQIYPTTHDYTADTAKIDAAELAHIEALKADEAAFTVEQFNADEWKARMQEAITKKDGEAVDTLFGELPDELSNTAHDMDGETYAEYILRAQNNIEADAINDSRATSIATAKTQADAAVKDSETRAEAVTTRTLMLESWTEIFGAEQAQTYMEMSDAIAAWYERTTGNSADEFYSRYYEEARKSVEADVIGDYEKALKQRGLSRVDLYQVDRVRSEYIANKQTGAVDAAVKEFGTTNDVNEAGYILPDGKMLDLSGKREGGQAGNRSYDHRDVGRVMPTQGTQAMLDFASQTGSIRISGMGDNLYVDLIGTVPNGAQIRALKKAASNFSYITYDVTDTRGNILLSGDLPSKGSSIDAATNNARRIFEGTESGQDLETSYGGALYQSYRVGENVQNRSISQADAQNYARMLARSESEARSAIRNEPNKADRIAILKALHDINPDMAENVARSEVDMLRQAEGMGAKGAVVFGADGIKATIHAFEAADFSTLVHENAHVFRRVMKDVAERTGNKQVVKDLATIEEWAGVKDGNWTVPAEEKFARGFENYIATGEAPTPRLKAAFETFKGWMMQVYRTITGSAIDVKITDEVKGVFDRMLGAEQEANLSSRFADVRQKAKQVLSPERLAEFEQIRKERMKLSAEMLDNGGAVIRFSNGERNTLSPEQFAKYGSIDEIIKQAKQAQNNVVDSMIAADVANADMQTRPLGLNHPLYQRNKAQVSAAQFDMFAPQAEATDTGTTGGLLPGMQEATGMMFDVQPGTGSLAKMDAGTARTIYDIDPTKTAGEFRAGDIVQDADGKQHTVSGANMRSKIVTDKGRILDPQDVTRVAKQDTLFQRGELPKTGQEYTFRYLRNTKKSPWYGSRFLQDIEPAGRYMTQISETQAVDGADFESGSITFRNPLVLEFGEGYQSGANWKNILSEMYGGKKGRSLSKAIVKDGYDGIVTTEAGHTSEIVDLGGVESDGSKRVLFQRTDPFKEADLPIGSIEEAGQQPPHHEAMHEGYLENIAPLMKAMQQVAREQVGNKPLDGAMRDLSPEGAAMLKKYRNQVNADMAGTKNAATKWGEQSRDFAMLNYNKRYGIDRYIETIYPYQFFYTRSLATWAARALDKPAIFSQYARIKKQQDRYERDIPERLRGKIKISLPWLPDWMGDALYIDPMRTLFTPLNYARPFERMIQDNSYQQIEAERILQEWASDGTVAEKDIVDAIKNREGATWERAFAEAQIRRESEITNPMDFMNTMLGPAWYLTTPYKLLKGEQAGIGSTPILNTTRALDTVTQGTWAQPIGDLIGMIGKPEEMLRQKLGIPEFGEYGDYYVDRQLANMVADGLISSDEAQQAMIERTGATFDTARERVKMELAMRVPTASALLSGLTAENFAQGIGRLAMTAPVSLFGAGILPAGELEYRGLKSEWNEAWKRKDAGDDKAITAFFDDHPEYEAYLSKGKEPEERLRGYLVGQIWDGYMGLGTTDRKQANAEMGDEFQRDFLSTETRSYEGIDIEQLAAWAQMLNRSVPNTASTAPALAAPAPQIDYYDPEITRITDKFFNDRTRMFPDYYVKQNGYYNIPESDKSGRYKYLAQNPELKEYWDWKKAYEKKYPELVPIIKGQVFKQIDTSLWPPALLDYVTIYAYTGERLPKGAYKALEQVWLSEGKPLGSVDAWLSSDVAPALLYSEVR